MFLLVLLSRLVARLQLLPDHDYDDWDAGIPVTAVGDNDDMVKTVMMKRTRST